MAASYDLAVVGGGIVGLATAREILRRQPNLNIVVLEKEPRIGMHQTGHNSGVIHSGIYYKPGSLKARLCVAGKQQMIRFCQESGIPFQLCGKVIVATDEAELPRLQSLYERGLENGVADLRIIEADELREIEPHARGLRALLSPTTGIVDYGSVAATYAQQIKQAGGDVRVSHEVTAIHRSSDELSLETPHGVVRTRYMVSCAGLHSDRVARMTGGMPTPRIVPFRGDYYVLRHDRRHLVKTNIYPVPDPELPFLGVHFTPRMDGDIWCGPNAVLAFAREGYNRFDFNVKDNLETFSYGGFWKMSAQMWRTGVDELVRDYSKALFLRALQRYLPELTADDILPGPAGVRAQALDADGKLVDDFLISASKRVIHVRNAPSPAATSSLAIGEVIANAIEKTFELTPSRPVAVAATVA